MVISKAITAENQWSDPFELRGDSHSRGLHARALVCSTDADSIVSIYRCTQAGVAISDVLDLGSVMEAIEVPVTGWYKVGVATGAYGGTALTITVEQ